jgi:hypothetical protein
MGTSAVDSQSCPGHVFFVAQDETIRENQLQFSVLVTQYCPRLVITAFNADQQTAAETALEIDGPEGAAGSTHVWRPTDNRKTNREHRRCRYNQAENRDRFE